MKKSRLLGAVCACLPMLVVLIIGNSAYAGTINLSLSDFVIFSGGSLAIDGGYETSIGGHTAINGNIGSNQDLFLQGNPLTGYPAQLNGSAYAGGQLTFGQDLTVGSSTQSYQVVANGAASIGGGDTIWGTLDAASATLGQGALVTGGTTAPSSTTFGLVSMWGATSFTAGGANQTVPTGQNQSLTLGAGTYGALSTTSQNQTVRLSDAGNYYFDSMTAQGGFKLEVDLTNGPVNIYVVGDVDLGAQNIQLMVKGAGTGGAFVAIDQAPSLAGLIYLETKGNFSLGGSGKWGGTVYSTQNGVGVNIGQYTDWTGAVYALDSVDILDHGTWNFVPQSTIPIPAAAWLFGGALGLLGFARRRSAA